MSKSNLLEHISVLKPIKMNIEDFRIYCLAKAGVTESLPFDNNTLVFKVMNKMFALTSLAAEEFTVNLKCDPERALELRASYIGVQPGYHMNKKHWNTVAFEEDVPPQLCYELIDHSYDLVVQKLTKKDQALLQKMNGEL